MLRRRSTLRPRRRTGTGSYGPEVVEEPRKRHSIASGTMEFENDGEQVEADEVAALRDGVGSPRNRARSLSATLVDIFTSSGKKGGPGDGDGGRGES